MTLFSPDEKISISHYRLVWNPTFLLPFGPEAKIHNTVCSGTGCHIINTAVPGGSRRKFGFSEAIFHFLILKVESILILLILKFSLEANFHITGWSGI
jgi:hypothetical protein